MRIHARRRDEKFNHPAKKGRASREVSAVRGDKRGQRTDGRGAGKCDTNATRTNAGKQAHVAA